MNIKNLLSVLFLLLSFSVFAQTGGPIQHVSGGGGSSADVKCDSVTWTIVANPVTLTDTLNIQSCWSGGVVIDKDTIVTRGGTPTIISSDSTLIVTALGADSFDIKIPDVECEEINYFIQRPAGVRNWTQGATTSLDATSIEVELDYTPVYLTDVFMFGLSKSTYFAANAFSSHDYLLYAVTAGNFYSVYENGTNTFTSNIVGATGDELEVRIVGSAVEYVVNSTVIYTSNITPTGTYKGVFVPYSTTGELKFTLSGTPDLEWENETSLLIVNPLQTVTVPFNSLVSNLCSGGGGSSADVKCDSVTWTIVANPVTVTDTFNIQSCWSGGVVIDRDTIVTHGGTLGGLTNYSFLQLDGSIPQDNTSDVRRDGNTGFNVNPAYAIHVKDDRIRVQGDGGRTTSLTFDDQTIFPLQGFGHTTIQENANGQGTRFYLMPKGDVSSNPSGLASGIKIFSTDYADDQVNYHDWGLYVTQEALISNSKRAGTYPSNLPFQWRYQDTAIRMELQAKSNGALMIGVPKVNEKNWNIFEPLHLGQGGVLLGRNNAPTVDLIANTYYNSGWKSIIPNKGVTRFSLGVNGEFVMYDDNQPTSSDASVSWKQRFIQKGGRIALVDGANTTNVNTVNALPSMMTLYSSKLTNTDLVFNIRDNSNASTVAFYADGTASVKTIVNMNDPISAQDAVTKNYVDNLVNYPHYPTVAAAQTANETNFFTVPVTVEGVPVKMLIKL